MPNVAFKRYEVVQMLPIWQQIRDCIEGETAIKGMYHPGRLPVDSMGSTTGVTTVGNDVVQSNTDIRQYLPMPGVEDTSIENLLRYKAYVVRAQFYPVTSRTIDGLTGQVFQRDPEKILPDKMNVMVQDADGQGLDLLQVAQKAVTTVLAYGRMGILTDYPKTKVGATKQQLADGDIRPVLISYDPWNIINWTTIQRGARRILSMVVLREVVDSVNQDEFEITKTEQFRVLRLNAAGVHTVEIWSKDAEIPLNTNLPTTAGIPKSAGKASGYTKGDVITPLDANGKPLSEIPFQFVGAESNDWFVDKPPMADIASLNIGHYRNSADYEESCFIAGQPTPVLSGLEQSWVDKNFKDKKLQLGSRNAIVLGKDAKAELLQAAANSMPMEAMKHKEEQMMSIGAKLITHNKTTRTATETTVQQSSENSTLGNIAINVSSAIEKALVRAAIYIGIPIAIDPASGKEASIKYTLNSDFDLIKKTAQEIAQIVANWQAGVTSWTEARVSLRAAGYTTQTDEEAKQEIQEEKAAAFQLGGHPIADPFDLPLGVTPPSPLAPPGSPAANAAVAAAAPKPVANNQAGGSTKK